MSWKTSNKKIATVTQKGVVKAKKIGKAKITATVKGTSKKATCQIIVKQGVDKVTVSASKTKLIVGETLKVSVKVSPSKAHNKNVTYSSSNKAVATVSSNGTVTAVKPGTVKITATAKDGTKKKGSVTLTIVEPPHVHAPEYTAALAPDCEFAGNVDYWYCASYDKYFADAECTNEIAEAETVLPAFGHDLEHFDAMEPACHSTVR